MKKISLILVFLLFGCTDVVKKIEQLPILQKAETPEEIPQTHHQFESRDLKTEKKNERKTQVALFLPFSGKNKDLGWHLFNTAVLSLFENDKNHNIELVLIDSKDSLQEATKNFKEVVDRKIKIVIGPIFSLSVEAIESDAKKNGITVISLSNNPKLSGKINNDGGIFLGGMMPEAQVDKIVGYALQQGKYSFSIIAPNNQYGISFANLFKKVVKNRDGIFITSEFYEGSDKDLDRAVDHAINAFTVPNRLTQSRGNKLKKDAVINDSDRTYAQVIVIPESGKTLSKIAALIKVQNKDERDFQLVGSSQWDDISTLNDPNLLGGLFAAPENERFRNFEKTYYGSYDKFPPRISSIVYDSVTAISQIIDSKKSLPSVTDFTNYSGKINGFEGIDGQFRFLPNGLIQRNLAVLKVSGGRFETVDKPADKFLKY